MGPTCYILNYNPYKWPFKWVTGVITLLGGVITRFVTGRGPSCTKSTMPEPFSGALLVEVSRMVLWSSIVASNIEE